MFSLAAFSIVSLHCNSDILAIIFHEEVVLWSCQFVILNASYVWMPFSFSTLLEYLALISLSRFSILLLFIFVAHEFLVFVC